MNSQSTKKSNVPLVSVIIDNYNYGQFIGKAIDSVLAQTYQNFELIVVDDGSTDNSRQVIESYGERIIAVFQTNQGQGGALNSGIAQAKGEIVCFLDADDYFYPQKLEKVVAAFNQHPEWVQISHFWSCVDAEDKPISSSNKSLSRGDVRKLLLQRGKYKSALTSALAYRRDVLDKVLPVPKVRDCADAYLMAAVPFYGQVGSINEALMFYRIHSKNLHARKIDCQHHIRGRELISSYINQTAEKAGLNERFELERDADYRTFEALQRGGVSYREALSVILLTWSECMAIRRSFTESIVRIIWGSICILYPEDGKLVLQLGLSRYLRFRLFGKKSPI